MYNAMLVDDEILVRNAMRDNIKWREIGFDLEIVCKNGKEAVDYLKEHSLDLVITDICMPYMDGIEVSQYLFENQPKTKIIILSGYSEFEYAKKSIQYNVFEYVLKPITGSEFSELLVKAKDKIDESRDEEENFTKLSHGYKNFRKNEKSIQSNILFNLISGFQSCEDCLREISDLGIDFTRNYYSTVIIELDAYKYMNFDKNDERKESALMAFVVENICGEILKQYNCGIAFQNQNSQIFMLLYTNNPVVFAKQAKDICIQIKDKIYETTHLIISMCVGNFVKGESDISKSYEAAKEAMKCHYTLGEGMFINLETDIGMISGDIDLVNELDEISENICKNNFNMVNNILNSIYVKMKQAYLTRDKANIYLQMIIRTISEIEKYFNLSANDIETNRSKVLSEVIKCHQLSDATGIILQYAKDMIENMHSDSISTTKRYSMLAVKYIRENYGDCELNLNSICKHLNVSISYFSTILKDEIGETFTELLINIRMEKAKELLLHSDLKNYEIASAVGFSDPHYFSIVFKKMIGMTPTEYSKRGKYDLKT